MSGICLVSGTDDAPDRVERMVDLMAMHGQKTAVALVSPMLAVGRSYHGRLASGRAPVRNSDGVTIVFDGELFDTDGPVADPEVLIAALYRNGELDLCARLNGSFVAIIVDQPKGRIVLAGDRLGTRSLFLWHRGNQVSVASRMHALLSDNRVPRRLSVQGLTELLSYQRTVADHTQYADVAGLTGSTIITIEHGRLSKRQTRRLAWRRPDFTEEEGGDRLAHAVRQAVNRRTADPVRHGLLLSGGLDARMVLAAARSSGRSLACATVGTHENLEVSIAGKIAKQAGAPFSFYHSPVSKLEQAFDPSTLDSDGLFASPINLFGQLPEMARHHDVLLSGHALDYTLRGYYLPCKMVRLAGSITRLPYLRPVPDGSPATVAASLRVGIKQSGVQSVLKPEVYAEWEARRVSAMAAAIGAADIENPYDAWDAFILTTQGRHYAYSDFVAMESVINQRVIAFDPDIFDLYLAMPPEWRASGRMVHAAMMKLGPDLMDLPDANNGFPACYAFNTQIALIFCRAVLRKMGFFRLPSLPDPTVTHGSWANHSELLRRDPVFVSRLRDLSKRDALSETGLFQAGGIAQVVEEHLHARENHVKLLLQLLTMASWFERHSYSEVDRGF